MSDEKSELLGHGVKLAGEYFVPGASNLIKGDFKQGAIHAALGFAAKAALGLPGLILVSLNSFSKATTDRHLYEHVDLGSKKEEGKKAAAK